MSVLVLGIGCAWFASGPPATPGTYTCASGTRFTADAGGVWDNGDDMILSCHGWPLTVVWRVDADQSVDTDVIGRLYGDGGLADHCTWAP